MSDTAAIVATITYPDVPGESPRIVGAAMHGCKCRES